MFYISYLKINFLKNNNNILSTLSNDIISIILRIILLKNRFITFGENSKLKIILIRLALVCKNWYDILKNDQQIIDICLGKDLYYIIGSFNEHCKSTYSDCSSFKKLNTICRSIIWTNYKNIIIKSSSNNGFNYNLLVINNYKFSDEDEVLYELIRWIGINKKFIHTNLLKLNYYFLEDNNLNLLFESTDLSLNYLLHKSFTSSSFISEPLGKNIIKSIMYQLFLVLDYLHKNNIYHGNISPLRILLQRKNGNFLVKLTDFRHSPTYLTCNQTKDQPIMPSYRSPELFLDHIYSDKNDIWASGMVMYTMINGYWNLNWQIVGSENIKSLIKNKKLEIEIEDLLLNLLKVDYKKRFTSKDALKHKYFKDIKEICPIVNEILNRENISEEIKSDILDQDMLIGKSKSIFRPKFLSELNERMWIILINWLIEVSFKCKLNIINLEIAVCYIYEYLLFKNVSRKDFQMVGCTGLYLANQWSDIMLMPQSDFVYISDKAFTKEDFKESIKDMFMKLDGNLYVNTIIEQKDKLKDLLNYKLILNEWLEMLIYVIQIDYSLITLHNNIKLYCLLYIIDLLNELICGKKNNKLRYELFNNVNFRSIKKSVLNKIYDLLVKINPNNSVKEKIYFTEESKKIYNKFSEMLSLDIFVNRYGSRKRKTKIKILSLFRERNQKLSISDDTKDDFLISFSKLTESIILRDLRC